MIALAALALASALGCGGGAPPRQPPPQPGARLELQGRLSRKGPDLGGFWAITDDAGQEWELVEATPEQAATMERLQNGRVRASVTYRRRLLRHEVVLLKLTRSEPDEPAGEPDPPAR